MPWNYPDGTTDAMIDALSYSDGEEEVIDETCDGCPDFDTPECDLQTGCPKVLEALNDYYSQY